MCSDRRDAKKELDAILEELLNSIEAAPAEEIADELRAVGRDVNSMAAEAKHSLLSGVKRFEQRKLQAAREAYKSRTGAQRKKHALPSTPAGRRDHLLAILAAKPQMQAMLTVQHRDFESLTDDDVKSALEELGELGVFEDDEGKQSK
jgi:hypothetical protein